MQHHTYVNKWRVEDEEEENIAQLEQPKENKGRYMNFFLFPCSDYQHISVTENKIFTVCKQKKKEARYIHMVERKKTDSFYNNREKKANNRCM